ncbi:MAG: hypothetical protein HC849_00940 [Oscillatoriales cyanobacterium RU_3_3]|nr:hypothetical protein [Microcoleus sp. SU_5_3]NJL66113.1 hypothetical protein [Microcoleus sp. SM1_3_4]NJM59075.1 hypothetical protein [Oscillatoriales cyanobacterium RU_3_3]
MLSINIDCEAIASLIFEPDRRLRPEDKNFCNSIYFFEDPEIQAQLELNEDRIVIKINFWPFILAQP